jgi:hypothetical protein
MQHFVLILGLYVRLSLALWWDDWFALFHRQAAQTPGPEDVFELGDEAYFITKHGLPDGRRGVLLHSVPRGQALDSVPLFRILYRKTLSSQQGVPVSLVRLSGPVKSLKLADEHTVDDMYLELHKQTDLNGVLHDLQDWHSSAPLETEAVLQRLLLWESPSTDHYLAPLFKRASESESDSWIVKVMLDHPRLVHWNHLESQHSSNALLSVIDFVNVMISSKKHTLFSQHLSVHQLKEIVYVLFARHEFKKCHQVFSHPVLWTKVTDQAFSEVLADLLILKDKEIFRHIVREPYLDKIHESEAMQLLLQMMELKLDISGTIIVHEVPVRRLLPKLSQLGRQIVVDKWKSRAISGEYLYDLLTFSPVVETIREDYGQLLLNLLETPQSQTLGSKLVGDTEILQYLTKKDIHSIMSLVMKNGNRDRMFWEDFLNDHLIELASGEDLGSLFLTLLKESPSDAFLLVGHYTAAQKISSAKESELNRVFLENPKELFSIMKTFDSKIALSSELWMNTFYAMMISGQYSKASQVLKETSLRRHAHDELGKLEDVLHSVTQSHSLEKDLQIHLKLREEQQNIRKQFQRKLFQGPRASMHVVPKHQINRQVQVPSRRLSTKAREHPFGNHGSSSSFRSIRSSGIHLI